MDLSYICEYANHQVANYHSPISHTRWSRYPLLAAARALSRRSTTSLALQ